MRKIMNRPDDYASEMLDGFVAAHSRFYKKLPDVNGIISRDLRNDKVALVIGGGSGHEPMFAGFVGKGLADAAACGNIFASPDPNTICQTAMAVHQGKGILFVYGCYAGDNLNFDMAEEMLEAKGIHCAHVRVWDDAASAPADRIEDRRGIAGDVFVIKIAGAACDRGLNLEEALRVTEKARNQTRSIGVATSPAQLPGAGKPIFELDAGKMEFGMGIHGEKGIRQISWKPADELVEDMYRYLKGDFELEAGSQVCVLVNGLGSTSIAELAIVYRKLFCLLSEDNITVIDSDLNQYCTSQEMGGFSISIMKLDEELKALYMEDCCSPYYFFNASEYRKEKEDIEVIHESKKDETKDVDGEKVNHRETAGPIDALDVQKSREMLLYIAQKIISNTELLTEIDSATGDGDHGFGMERGMHKVIETVTNFKDTGDVYELFDRAGKAMLMSMGGASGVIFGSLFFAGAAGCRRTGVLGPADLAVMFEKSLASIKKRGKASPGDKTMVDALEPAVEAMSLYADRGMVKMLREAENAAKEGLENTKKYQVKFGRAKSLQERSIGYRDAGAASVWLIMQGMREFTEGAAL